MFVKHMSVKIKSFFEEIAGEKAPGPTPTFSVLHLIRVLEILAESPVGRGKLAEELNVGQGVIRTIIKRLKQAGLISTSKEGCRLTAKGLKIWDKYKKVFGGKVEIKQDKLIPADYNFAILVKNCGNKVSTGIEQRDAAIKLGAKGAAAIIFKEGRFIIPSVSDDVSKEYPSLIVQLLRSLNPEENDVIIVGGADDVYRAEYGAMAAMWTLLD